jgi:hypothetical protein
MHLPGFTAEVSVYESFHFYRGILASAIGGEVQPQQTKGCGPCYIHANGKCAKDCVIPGREFVTPCPASACVACGPCKCTKNCAGTVTPC